MIRKWNEKEILNYIFANLSDNPKQEPLKDDGKDKPKPKKKVDKETFEYKIKDYKKVEGLFTFYVKEDENKALMVINPDQLEKIYLASFTRQ